MFTSSTCRDGAAEVVVAKDLREERTECDQGGEDTLVDVDAWFLDGLEDGIVVEDRAEGQTLVLREGLKNGVSVVRATLGGMEFVKTDPPLAGSVWWYTSVEG